MKTKVFLLIAVLLGAFAVAIFAQDTTQVVLTGVEGQTPLEFLKANMYTLLFALFWVIDAWLGQTGWIKEGSIPALIINFIGKFLGSKADIIKSKEENRAVYMAKRKEYKEKAMAEKRRKEFPHLPVIVLAIALMSGVFSLDGSAQDKNLKSMFRPVDDDMFAQRLELYGATDADKAQSVWLPRFNTAVAFVKLTPTSEDKQVFESKPFSAVGFGAGYQHFINSNNKPYNNYGFNVLLLLNIDPTETGPSGISLAGTVNAFEFINVGAGYDFQAKTYFLMTGVNITL